MPTVTSTARTPLDQHIQGLAAFEPTPFPVISLYLDLSANQHDRHRHGPFVRNVLADRRRGLRPATPEHASFERDAERIEAYLRDELDPDASGLALFACAGMNRASHTAPGKLVALASPAITWTCGLRAATTLSRSVSTRWSPSSLA